MSAAVTCAVNCVPLTKVVGRSLPLNLATEPLTNLLPFTVNVKAAAPAVVVEGEILVRGEFNFGHATSDLAQLSFGKP